MIFSFQAKTWGGMGKVALLGVRCGSLLGGNGPSPHQASTPCGSDLPMPPLFSRSKAAKENPRRAGSSAWSSSALPTPHTGTVSHTGEARLQQGTGPSQVLLSPQGSLLPNLSHLHSPFPGIAIHISPSFCPCPCWHLQVSGALTCLSAPLMALRPQWLALMNGASGGLRSFPLWVLEGRGMAGGR